MENNSQEVKSLNDFFNFFKKADYKNMIKFYNEKATFSDPVFKNLSKAEIDKMWTFLLKNKKEKDINLKYELIDGKNLIVKWECTYLFGRKNQKVYNQVTSKFKFSEDKIIEQIDDFDFKNWSKQSLGLIGKIFGNKKWFNKLVSKKAAKKVKK